MTLPPRHPELARPFPPHAAGMAQASYYCAPYFCGIDIGGTGIKIGLVDDQGRTLGCTSVPTDPQDGFDAALERIIAAIETLTAESGITFADLAGVGCGIPGLIDLQAGTLLSAHNLPTWDNTPVVVLLSEKLGLPVTFANDANAATYGEFWSGGGRSRRSLVLLTLGTGVGGGIVLDGTLVHGAHDIGGELGHIIIDSRDDARLCGCGQRGHLEAYCSATAVRQRTEDALAAGANGRLSVLRAKGQTLTALDVSEAAQAGDATGLRIMRARRRVIWGSASRPSSTCWIPTSY
ncbi:MAG: ROK family protein [Pirellulales bacterium]